MTFDARTVTTNGTVPSDTVGTVPSNDDTVVSNDTVLCSGEMTLDMSSQSVEIITNEESNLLDLDLHVTSDVTSHDLDPDAEGQFMSAKFYIGESLPSSPSSGSAASARKVGQVNCPVVTRNVGQVNAVTGCDACSVGTKGHGWNCQRACISD